MNQKNVSNYFDILDDLLLGHRVPVFSKRAKRQTVQHPKFYLFDVGVYQTLRPKGFTDSQAEIDGAAMETLFLQSLRAINDYYEYDYQIFYWRTTGGVEVDFIIYGPRGLLAFEIKRSATAQRSDAKHLISFKKDYPEAKLFLIYGGKEKYYFNDVRVIPMRDALFELPEILQ